MSNGFSLASYGLSVADIRRNASPAVLYEDAILTGDGKIASAGPLITSSGAKTGRSPKDKRIVDTPAVHDDVWWGEVNRPLDPAVYAKHRARALEFLNARPRLYVVDGFAGWHPKYRIKVRTICARPYHALFMHNMLIRPTADELANFGEPDYTIINAGQAAADASLPQTTSSTVIALDLHRKNESGGNEPGGNGTAAAQDVGGSPNSRGEVILLGTEYAGEMKKGVFTIINYLLPKRDVLSMHCAANEGAGGDVTLFFGLSGTGKTTLSADPRRRLIGDDEHGWAEDGVFNVEGGCYAKCIHLSAQGEPDIFDALKFGAVLENVVFDPATREPNFNDDSITENTRASYPIDFMWNAKIPCVGGVPKNIILLTCDAFGVLPPVSRLTTPQAMYHFVSGYTAKVAGTEQGLREPTATFSSCFGAAFLVWHPLRYAEMLAERMERHNAQAWLINTGWSGGPYGVGSRIPLAHTRAILDAIHAGTLHSAPTETNPIFGLRAVTKCPNVPDRILSPRECWKSTADYDVQARTLAGLFREHFSQFAPFASDATLAAGPPENVVAGRTASTARS